MPELPEVETTKQQLELYLQQNTLLRCEVRRANLRWPVSPEISLLHHVPIRSLSRRGKYLVLSLEEGYILIHLGMTGFFKVLHTEVPPEKHDHIDLFLKCGTILRYNDSRRFGCWLWFEQLEQVKPLQHLGVEPLSEELSVDYLQRRFRGKKLGIKQAIMDAHCIVGVGNIYASEALFCARIHPLTPAGQLDACSLYRLIKAIRSVLEEALRSGGTTIRDFQQPEGKLGYFAQKLQVYNRAGKACRVCETVIENRRIGQRSSYFCPNCQKPV
ncbi:MAG: bifunctional DNA-formamidopyrimidine glycosylase/DNA-(apurinic or apyrimidinic site) lyase [Neisseriaceae bacterium]